MSVNPYLLLPRANTGLLVIDFQEKLFPHVLDRERITARAIFAIACLRRLGLPVIVSEQYPKGLGVTVPEIREALAEDYRPLAKTAFSCLGEPALAERIAGLDNLLVIGIETHICVAQTVLQALPAQRVHVLADAVGARGEVDHREGLNRMRLAGAVISTAETAVYELLGAAKTPEHKLLFDLLK